MPIQENFKILPPGAVQRPGDLAWNEAAQDFIEIDPGLYGVEKPPDNPNDAQVIRLLSSPFANEFP